MAPSPRTHARLRANDEREVKSKALTMFETGSAMPMGVGSPMRDKIRTEIARLEARSAVNRRAHRAGRNAHQRAVNRERSASRHRSTSRSRTGGTKRRKTRKARN